MKLPSTPIDNLVNGTLHGFKVARIVETSDGFAFCGAGLGTTYGAVDQAVCVRNREHVPPEPDGCGFYAWKSRDRALDLMARRPVVALLDVELWGRFEEFEHGYIAAVQLVRQVTVNPYCTICLFSRDARPRPASVLASIPGTEAGDLASVCDEHAVEAETVVTLGGLAEQLGVEVAFAGDDDPVVEAVKLAADAMFPHPPVPRVVRRLDELPPGEIGHVFANALAADGDGNLWIDPLARLIQPLPGTDVPVRLNEDGEHEVLLDGLTRFEGWQPRTDIRRFALPVRTVGELKIVAGEQAS